ncbi:unnamed protein product, partial [Amoebophrya sp. A25]
IAPEQPQKSAWTGAKHAAAPVETSKAVAAPSSATTKKGDAKKQNVDSLCAAQAEGKKGAKGGVDSKREKQKNAKEASSTTGGARDQKQHAAPETTDKKGRGKSKDKESSGKQGKDTTASRNKGSKDKQGGSSKPPGGEGQKGSSTKNTTKKAAAPTGSATSSATSSTSITVSGSTNFSSKDASAKSTVVVPKDSKNVVVDKRTAADGGGEQVVDPGTAPAKKKRNRRRKKPAATADGDFFENEDEEDHQIIKQEVTEVVEAQTTVAKSSTSTSSKNPVAETPEATSKSRTTSKSSQQPAGAQNHVSFAAKRSSEVVLVPASEAKTAWQTRNSFGGMAFSDSDSDSDGDHDRDHASRRGGGEDDSRRQPASPDFAKTKSIEDAVVCLWEKVNLAGPKQDDSTKDGKSSTSGGGESGSGRRRKKKQSSSGAQQAGATKMVSADVSTTRTTPGGVPILGDELPDDAPLLPGATTAAVVSFATKIEETGTLDGSTNNLGGGKKAGTKSKKKKKAVPQDSDEEALQLAMVEKKAELLPFFVFRHGRGGSAAATAFSSSSSTTMPSGSWSSGSGTSSATSAGATPCHQQGSWCASSSSTGGSAAATASNLTSFHLEFENRRADLDRLLAGPMYKMEDKAGLAAACTVSKCDLKAISSQAACRARCLKLSQELKKLCAGLWEFPDRDTEIEEEERLVIEEFARRKSAGAPLVLKQQTPASSTNKARNSGSSLDAGTLGGDQSRLSVFSQTRVKGLDRVQWESVENCLREFGRLVERSCKGAGEYVLIAQHGAVNDIFNIVLKLPDVFAAHLAAGLSVAGNAIVASSQSGSSASSAGVDATTPGDQSKRSPSCYEDDDDIFSGAVASRKGKNRSAASSSATNGNVDQSTAASTVLAAGAQFTANTPYMQKTVTGSMLTAIVAALKVLVQLCKNSACRSFFLFTDRLRPLIVCALRCLELLEMLEYREKVTGQPKTPKQTASKTPTAAGSKSTVVSHVSSAATTLFEQEGGAGSSAVIGVRPSGGRTSEKHKAGGRDSHSSGTTARKKGSAVVFSPSATSPEARFSSSAGEHGVHSLVDFDLTAPEYEQLQHQVLSVSPLIMDCFFMRQERVEAHRSTNFQFLCTHLSQIFHILTLNLGGAATACAGSSTTSSSGGTNNSGLLLGAGSTRGTSALTATGAPIVKLDLSGAAGFGAMAESDGGTPTGSVMNSARSATSSSSTTTACSSSNEQDASKTAEHSRTKLRDLLVEYMFVSGFGDRLRSRFRHASMFQIYETQTTFLLRASILLQHLVKNV